MQLKDYEEKDKVVIGCCRVIDLDKIDVRRKVKKYGEGYIPSKVMKGSKTVIVVASIEDMSKDTVKKGILQDDYPAYKKSREVAKEIENQLKKEGYNAKTTLAISIKNAAILSGMGVWGKNSLVINELYGTHMRMCAVLTDWEPKEYGKPIEKNLCAECTKCIDACPHKCLTPYEVNGPLCQCKYLDKNTTFSREMKMCAICQDVCKYNEIFNKV